MVVDAGRFWLRRRMFSGRSDVRGGEPLVLTVVPAHRSASIDARQGRLPVRYRLPVPGS